MSSTVFFKFKSQKEPTKITFDGTGISVFELKREIISVSQLGDGTDFDLAIYTENTNEEYDDDTTIVPRSTTVVARRIPATRPGHGRAARYVSGQAPVTAKNAYRTEASHKVAGQDKPTSSAANVSSAMNEAQTEEERLAAMFRADASQWEQQQRDMALAKPVFSRQWKGKPANVPDHDPPPGYICYRCHEKGHWIQLCPTNDDPNFEAKPKIKRTTGIPNSFLKTVEKPVTSKDDGLSEERQPNGVMINAKGEYVVAEPDKASWDRFQAKAEASKEQQAAASLGDKDLADRGLECPLDKKIFVDPVKTPCCGKTYCHECIENALLESDLTCPNCSTPNILIDDLAADDETREKVRAYEAAKAGEKNTQDAAKSPAASVTGETTVPSTTAAKASTPKPEEKELAKATTPAKSDTGTPMPSAVQPVTAPKSPMKRAAEEDLKDDRIPTGPKAMRTENGAKTSAAAFSAAPNGQAMPALNFPNMNGMPLPDPTMMMMNPGMMPNGGMMPGGGFNPMLNPMMNGYGGMGAGPGGFNNNMNMNGMNMGMGMNMGGMGFPQQGGMYNPNGFGGQQQQHQTWQGNGQWANNANFGNQQRNGFVAAGNDEDSAYQRGPVNPHRHMNRQRRVRPSDYTEL